MENANEIQKPQWLIIIGFFIANVIAIGYLVNDSDRVDNERDKINADIVTQSIKIQADTAKINAEIMAILDKIRKS